MQMVVLLPAETEIKAGWVILTGTTVDPEAKSVTFTEYVPAESPLAVAAVWPPGIHEYV